MAGSRPMASQAASSACAWFRATSRQPCSSSSWARRGSPKRHPHLAMASGQGQGPPAAAGHGQGQARAVARSRAPTRASTAWYQRPSSSSVCGSVSRWSSCATNSSNRAVRSPRDHGAWPRAVGVPPGAAGPDAHGDPPPGDVVEGHGLLGQRDRVPEVGRRDERAQPQRRGGGGHRRQHGDGSEPRAVAEALPGEVVIGPRGVRAQRLGPGPHRSGLAPAHGGQDHHSQAHRADAQVRSTGRLRVRPSRRPPRDAGEALVGRLRAGCGLVVDLARRLFRPRPTCLRSTSDGHHDASLPAGSGRRLCGADQAPDHRAAAGHHRPHYGGGRAGHPAGVADGGHGGGRDAWPPAAPTPSTCTSTATSTP